MPGDVRGCGGCQEEDPSCGLLGLTGSSEGDVAEITLHSLPWNTESDLLPLNLDELPFLLGSREAGVDETKGDGVAP